MVGGRARSNGCHTCRRRKVKCDEKRPLCERCTKARLQCEGYEHPLEFRIYVSTNNTEDFRMLASMSSKGRVSFGSQSPLSISGPDLNEPISFTEQTVPHSLSLVAFKDILEFSYLFDNFVWQTYGWPWLEISAKGKLGKLSLDACQYLAQSIFGKHYHQPDIQLQGQVLYGQTIRMLSQEIADIARPGAEGLIVPILLLLMHASSNADRQAAYFHVMGLNKVIQACDPIRFAKIPLRSAFESARSTLFTVSLASKTRSFLEQPAWKTDPWRDLGLPPKSPQSELVDIMIDLPGYLQDISEIERGIADRTMQADLVNRLKANLTTLYHWRWRWEMENSNAAWEVEPADLSPNKIICNFRVFHKILWFRTFTQATEIQLYNTMLLCTLGLLWRFEPQDEINTVTLSFGILRMPGQYNSLYEPAVEICRAFEYQLLNVTCCRESALFWLLPLGVAHKVLEDDFRYSRWIQSMLETSKLTRGYGSGNNEFAFGRYEFLNHTLKRQILDLNVRKGNKFPDLIEKSHHVRRY